MDFSSVVTAVSALRLAKEAADAALGVRDFNAYAAAISKVNDQLLKAQESLFFHNSQLLQMQSEMVSDREELARLRKVLEDRGRYTLVDLGTGNFVYRYQGQKPGEDAVGNEPVAATHDICQPCYDKGVRSVLQRSNRVGDVTLDCTICDAQFRTGESIPYPDIGRSARSDFI